MAEPIMKDLPEGADTVSPLVGGLALVKPVFHVAKVGVAAADNILYPC